MFCLASFTLVVPRTLSEQMGNSRRVTRHPVYFGSPFLQKPDFWAKCDLCQSTRERRWQGLPHVYFWLSPDAVSLEELWHHSLCLFTRAWHYKWLIENVNRGCQPDSIHTDIGSHTEWLRQGCIGAWRQSQTIRTRSDLNYSPVKPYLKPEPLPLHSW